MVAGQPAASRSFAGRASRSASRRSRARAASATRRDRLTCPATRSGSRRAGTGRCRAGRARQARHRRRRAGRLVPGLTTAAFAGGYTVALWVGDAATASAREAWHNAANDKAFSNHHARSSGPATGSSSRRSLTSGSATTRCPRTVTAPGRPRRRCSRRATAWWRTSALSGDGRTLFYCTNAGDIDRRHVWKVPTAGGEAVQLTTGTGHRDLPGRRWRRRASGRAQRRRTAATVDRRRAGGGRSREGSIYPALPKDYPLAQHVVPENVIVKAADGLEIHNQLFLPAGLEARRAPPGDRLRPRRPGAADAARLSLHVVLPPVVHGESVARQPGLHRLLGQLPQRDRLRQVVPDRAEHRRARATRSTRTCWLPGSTCRRAPTSIRRGSASGASPTAAC